MKKKQQDYIFLLLFMIMSIITLSVLPRVFPDAAGYLKPVGIANAIVIALWYIFLYRVTSNFYNSKWIRGVYAALLMFQLQLMGYVNMPGHDIESFTGLATVAYSANLIGFSWIFYILLRDIFSQKHDLTYSLLGASNIYLMIPVLFTYSYSLIAVHTPSLVHADPLVIETVLMRCFDYSYYVVAGIDYPGEKIGETIQSIGVLESLSANLFIVFIIGRLMSK